LVRDEEIRRVPLTRRTKKQPNACGRTVGKTAIAEGLYIELWTVMYLIMQHKIGLSDKGALIAGPQGEFEERLKSKK
jgi:ATP-dependent Clp protease ATP-binding subunit ClpA